MAVPAAAAAALVSFLAIVAAATSAPRPHSEGACSSELEHQYDSTMFMQLGMKVRHKDEPVDFPNPVGRTFLSSSPALSAQYLQRYFNATAVALPSCEGAERAAVRLPPLFASASGFPPYMVFIKDAALSTGAVDVGEVEALLHTTLAAAESGEMAYTFHLDNHDGWRTRTVVDFFKRQVQEGLVMAAYRHDIEDLGAFDMLHQIPHTLLSVQTHQMRRGKVGHPELDDPMQGVRLKPVLQEDCRTDARSAGASGNWWKSTFSAAAPAEAAAFERPRGGEDHVPIAVDAPSECTAGAWVQLPGSGFQLHFVRAAVQFQGYDGEIDDFTGRILAARNLAAGKIDAFMLNSLILRVPSLDPYLDRLRALDLPFLLLRDGPEEFVLYLDVPKNAITIQLRSARANAAAGAVSG
eukprot:CAMPEP_0115638536 /NCGR_PEP_ID=MMETSP0272-20121206/34780_1 /TAXON_ID=71861 /ORGANISM="Scrippsiella trochoidea, Strain CCMP3099" /LENGTH=409 /DNA_ID=CAMNT_0003075665 /DNA_START=24 /DNA_END=1250 /DNA_ORIENTATION=-